MIELASPAEQHRFHEDNHESGVGDEEWQSSMLSVYAEESPEAALQDGSTRSRSSREPSFLWY